MKLIIGLGNPGEEYEKTRHNVGFLVIEDLRLKIEGFSNWKLDKKCETEVSCGHIASCCEDVILAKPQTFMNDSGRAVKAMVSGFRCQVSDILIVHDDIDLPLGTLRLSFGSGSAGQNGVQSIIDTLGTKDFWRLRIGIGPKLGEADKFVLKRFPRTQTATVKKSIENATEAITLMFSKGPHAAQTEINKT